ncbi:MAG TPA: hypothetical protein VFN10_09420 [Thermoanaerobaculia bacterium]|nr:hypothetical protein [Thermoanaerobaculia bacterium]
MFAIAIAGAEALPAGDSYVSFVPWKILQPEEDAPRSALVLYWIPASRDELRRSELLTSHVLMTASTQCVAMQVIRLDDAERIHKVASNEDQALPGALLADEEGHELARVDREDGELRTHEVESIVREALDAREANAELLLDEAARHADDGDVDAAIALYEKVWADRCVCPRQANEARRALKRLRK